MVFKTRYFFDIYIYIYLSKIFPLFVCFVWLLDIGWTFCCCRSDSYLTSQCDIYLLKTCNCNGGEQTIRLQLPDRSWSQAIGLSESFTGSAHTSRNSDFDCDSIVDPYLYEPEVEYPLNLQCLTMMKGSTTKLLKQEPLFFGKLT